MDMHEWFAKSAYEEEDNMQHNTIKDPEDILNSADNLRLRQMMNERATRLQEQERSNEILRNVNKKLDELKRNLGIEDELKRMEDNDTDLYVYISTLEAMARTTYCHRCNSTKSIASDVNVSVESMNGDKVLPNGMVQGADGVIRGADHGKDVLKPPNDPITAKKKNSKRYNLEESEDSEEPKEFSFDKQSHFGGAAHSECLPAERQSTFLSKSSEKEMVEAFVAMNTENHSIITSGALDVDKLQNQINSLWHVLDQLASYE